MHKPNLDVVRELEENYQKLKQFSEKLQSKVERLLEEESKSYRALVMEKELTQYLSGFAQFERLKIDILKTLQNIAEKLEHEKAEDDSIKQLLLDVKQVLNQNQDDLT